MKKLLFIIPVIGIVSCVKNYTYKKEVINESNSTIEVLAGCCGNEQSTVIGPRETATVFECTWQSIKKPDCSDVSKKMTIISENENHDLNIKKSENWMTSENGKTITCTHIVKD